MNGYNGADIDASRIVWGLGSGERENEKLRQYYPDRVVLMLDPDIPATPEICRYGGAE